MHNAQQAHGEANFTVDGLEVGQACIFFFFEAFESQIVLGDGCRSSGRGCRTTNYKYVVPHR